MKNARNKLHRIFERIFWLSDQDVEKLRNAFVAAFL